MVTPHPAAAANFHDQFSRRTDRNSHEPRRLAIVETWCLLLARLKAATAIIKARYDERASIEKEIDARVE